MKSILQTFERFVDDFAVENGHSLLICGTPGTGKTHAAVAILRELTARNYNCWFETFSSLLSKFRNTNNHDSNINEDRILAHLRRNYLLVLDDFVFDESSTYTQQVLHRIIDERYVDQKSLILTTNYPPDEIKARIMPHTWSRIDGMCKTIIMLTTKDFRKAGR